MAKVRITNLGNAPYEVSESTKEVADRVNAALLNRERWIVLTVDGANIAVIAEDVSWIRD